jgi:Flp pilus assembly protein TadD
MKKRKNNWNRPRPRGPTPNELFAAAKARRARLRLMGWVAGVGLMLVIGFWAFQKHRAAISPNSTLVQSTNTPATTSIAQRGGANGGTNRAGAAVNRESEGRADDLNNQAAQFLEKGDAKQAVQMFQQAVALNPGDETFHFNLGVALARVGDPTNAELQYKEALRLLPEYPEVHHNYGNLLFRAGRLAEAEAHLSEAVNELPESPTFNNSLGVLQQRLKKTNDALLSFQKAVECDSNYMEAHFNLALSYLNRKDRERGIAELRETLKLKPGFEPAQRTLDHVISTP